MQVGLVEDLCTPCDWPADASGGCASALQRRMVALRLHVARITERVRSLGTANAAPRTDAHDDLSEQHRALRDTVAKLVSRRPWPSNRSEFCLLVSEAHEKQAMTLPSTLLRSQQAMTLPSPLLRSHMLLGRLQAHVEESLESNYTCLTCLNVFTDPVACVPCGHTYCRACLERVGTEGQRWCQECGGADVQCTVALASLDKLAGKHAFKLAALRDLKTLCHLGDATGG